MTGTRKNRHRWVPGAIFILIFLVFVSIWGYGRHREKELLEAKTAIMARQVAIRLEEYVSVRLNRVAEMRELWLAGQISSPAPFSRYAMNLQRQLSGLQAVNWVGPDGTIEWVVPEGPNRLAQGRNLKQHPGAASTFLAAAETGQMRLTPPIELLQGGRGIAAYIPVIEGGQTIGFLNPVFRIDTLMEDALAKGVRDHFAVTISDGDQPVWASASLTPLMAAFASETQTINVGNRLWKLALTPSEKMIRGAHSAMAHLALFFGFLLAVGLALVYTLLVKREDQLAESEARYRTLFHNAQAGLLRLSPDGRIVDANRTIAAHFGYDDPERFVREFDFAAHWADAGERMGFERTLAERGEIQGFDALFNTENGRSFWLRLSARLFSEAGHVECVAIDVSQQKQAERALMESERKFRALAESTSAAIVIGKLTQDGRSTTLFANRAAVESSGYTMEEMGAIDSLELLHPDSAAIIRAWREAALRGEQPPIPPSSELQYRTKSGEWRWIETSSGDFELDGERAWVSTHFDVTERKRAEEALRISEAKYRNIFENAQVGLFRIRTSDGKVLESNPTMAKFYGYDSREQFVAEYYMAPNWVVPAERERLYAEFARGRGQVNNFEAQFYRKDKTPIWVRFSATLSPDKTYLEGVGIEITEEKETARALVESEQRFRALADSTSAVIFIFKNDRIVYANQAALKSSGYTWDELRTMDPGRMLHPDSIAEIARLQTECQQTGAQSEPIEIKVFSKSGELRHVESTSAVMLVDGEEAVISTNFDITERKRAEQALRESEASYRTIFETTGTATMMVDEGGIVTLANAEFAALTGWNRAEIEGRMSWTAFFAPDSARAMQEYKKRRDRDPASAPNQYEVKLVDRAGRVHEGLLLVGLVPGTTMRVASFLDLTARKQAERQMLRADKMAALGQIIAGVAHEINNPNNFIYFNLPILKRYIEAIRPWLDEAAQRRPDLMLLNMPYEAFLEDLHKLIDNMQHGSRRITGIVSELKDYIRSHEVEERRPQPLGHAIDHVMSLVGKQVGKTVKRMEVEVEEGLPPVMMNEGKIEQVLINLIINAGQAADKDDSFVRLKARRAETAPGFVAVDIADNGAGIAPEILSKIFDPFFTTKSRDQGTGLGLAICQRIVEEHGGRIAVESDVGRGTTFTVFLPVHAEGAA
ncbi:MAG: PAS domain S-box protein [Myxococcales bacterium]|nr:MAG: PAS domain S-box protein [Myxococcales bacterium]